MSRMKAIFAVLVLTAIVGIVPQVHAQTLKVVIEGSSAMWQALALGAYNGGTCSPALTGCVSPTFHYTSTGNFNLTDTRSSIPTVDTGAIWIVWDSASPANVWAYIKVDSVVGVRCYFAAPKCNVNVPSFPAAGNQISSTLWGADTLPPAGIQALFTAGTLATVGATDIRPEDALFATCRVNSTRGASAAGGGASDGLDGLGYNNNNNAGVCPAFNAGTAQAKGVGNPILSGVPGSSSKANVLAFNLTGTDPITGTKLPAAFTVTNVGAAPLIFVHGRQNTLANLDNASETQLQAAFSGTNCDASAFGLPGGAINIHLREPLSGTMNTTEATVFRRPTVYPGNVLGISQETGVNADLHGFKLDNTTACGGSGDRYRSIGTGQEISSVLNSNVAGKFAQQRDGIGYTFFSYGNVTSIANSANFGYITLNGVDPIFASYGTTIDPGQPTTPGTIPAEANLPATCPTPNQFPCDERFIWANGFSFPNLRNGTYRAWSLLRLVATGVPSTNAAALVKAGQRFVVEGIPDYVPYAAVAGLTTKEVGLKLLRSHYQQKDGAGTNLGAGPATNVPGKGGDMGGAIIPTTIGVTTQKQTKLIQSSNSDSSNLGPQLRP